ncbi:MAG TPA: hypothetical protein VN066_08190 [Rhodocyclaceae bacterium]|jgi:hypothetical protein|nr:hypothetical protein [Rhodocyclaceae bacterium]
MKKSLAASLVVVMLSAYGSAHAVTLIKEAEAKLPAASGSLATRGITRGPAIKQVSPPPDEAVKSPLNLKVSFEARGGAKIDPASVKAVYLKSPSVELTERVKPAVSDSGIELNDAVVPAGEHQISISVTDSEGRQSNSVITLKVAK